MFTARPSRYLARVNRLFDGACALIVMVVTYSWLNIGRVPGGLDEFLAVKLTIRNVAFGLLFLAIWHTCFALCGLYRQHAPQSLLSYAVRIVLSCTLATSLVSFFTLASRSGSFLQVVAYFWLAATTLEIAGRGAILAALHHARSRANEIKHAVIVGSGPQALKVFAAMKETKFRGCELAGFVDTVGDRVIPDDIAGRLIGSLDEFENVLSARAIDQVLIALPVKSCYAAIQQVIGTCERLGVEVVYFPDIFSVSLARRAYGHGGDVTAIRLHSVTDDYRLLIKRGIDLVGAICGLTLLCPLMVACAVAVKLSSQGPVLFTQVRYGYRKRLFRMYKFRTMVQDAEQLQSTLEEHNEAQGPIFKIRVDPRVTRVGRVLRKLSLDELPQLINVLRGDMSLVGPRPMSMRDVSRFSESWLLRRFSVRPGLTCLWQVNGRSNVGFDRWVELDLQYIDNWSLMLDAQILLKTVPAVFSGSGAM